MLAERTVCPDQAKTTQLRFDPGRRGLTRSVTLVIEEATAAVAVQHGVGAAQHLDDFNRAGIDGIDLRLAIHRGQRIAVLAYAQAADAERRTGPKTADRNARVLRKVVAVLDQHAGRQVQRIGGLYGCAAVPDVVIVDQRHPARSILPAGFDQRRTDGDPQRCLCVGFLRFTRTGPLHRGGQHDYQQQRWHRALFTDYCRSASVFACLSLYYSAAGLMT